MRRRGVSSILAMMYLVLFGSLAAAMAVVAQSNLRTADATVKVSRAMSAAETGLVFGSRRLAEQANRFVVEDGLIGEAFGFDLWRGALAETEVAVLPPPVDEAGDPIYIETIEPKGIMQAVLYLHENVDTHWFDAEASDAQLPSSDSNVGALRCKPIALGSGENDPYFRLRYEFIDQGEVGEDIAVVRITSTGVDGDIERSVSLDFMIAKRIKYAAVGPNRIMIGKNVMIEGPLGSRYGVDADGDPNTEELDLPNGDPVVLRSDFYDLDPDLDVLLDLFFTQVAENGYDVDGDGRLRPDHPVEGVAIALEPDLVDYDNDEYVDDFDLFLAFFDDDEDGKVVYDADLASGAGLGSLTVEYGGGATDDDQLMVLIDEARPDRDLDGDPDTWNDTQLGYRDGVIDVLDQYAKIDGQLMFAVERADWEFHHGESYQTEVQGPIRTTGDDAPVLFGVNDARMIELTTGMFGDSRTFYEAQVPASPAALADPPQDPSLLIGQAVVVGTYTPAAAMTIYEPVPFGSPGAYDFYQRPVYENFVFKNVRIPRGNNGLFINCTFIGVTWIETISAEDADGHWNYTGAYSWDDDDLDGIAEEGELTLGKFRQPGDPFSPMTTTLPNGDITDNTRLYSNNLRFDGCTFLGTIAGDRIGGGADDDRTYTHWRNKVMLSGETRFYNDPEDEDLLEQPDADDLVDYLEDMDADVLAQLQRSSIMLPGWSVDAGSFDAFAPKIKLSGVIVAGILDLRGRAELRGTLLMTYRPARNQGPLRVMGSINVDKFNTTIGYFSADAGDSEGQAPEPGEYGEIRIIYDPDADLPDGIPWPVTAVAVDDSYFEGG